jgi:hypothetical protein
MQRVGLSSRALGWAALVVVPAVALVPAEPVSAQPADPVLAEIRAAWAKRQEFVRSARITWVHKSLHPKGSWGKKGPDKDVVDNGTGSLLIDGDKARLTIRDLIWTDPLGRFAPRHRESTFDGKEFVTFEHPVPERLKFPYAILHKGDRNEDFNFLDYKPLRVALRGLDPNLGGSILERYTQVRRTVLDGRPVVELTEPRTEIRGESKVWLDPAQDYALRRFEDYVRTGEVFSRINVVTVRDLSGQWLPMNWTVQLISAKGQLRRQTDITLREVVLNPPTSEADFRITFPAGTVVDDLREMDPDGGGRRTSFLVRQDGSHRPIPRSEWQLPYEELVRSEPGELTGEVASWWKSRRGLLTLAGSLVGLLFIAVLARRWLWSRGKGGDSSATAPG